MESDLNKIWIFNTGNKKLHLFFIHIFGAHLILLESSLCDLRRIAIRIELEKPRAKMRVNMDDT